MFFKLPWFNKAKPHPYSDQVLELDFLVGASEDSLSDIQDPVRTRLYAALIACRNPQDLWCLRGQLFNLISRHHGEGVAHQRISRLDQRRPFFGTTTRTTRRTSGPRVRWPCCIDRGLPGPSSHRAPSGAGGFAISGGRRCAADPAGGCLESGA